MIPDLEQQNSHVIDLVSTAAKYYDEVEVDGKMQKQLILDPESIYFSTRIVNANTFGRFVYELKNLEALAHQASKYMSVYRANEFREAILQNLIQSYKKSIDALASQTFRDGHNSTLPLIDRLQRNKQERVYTVSDDLKNRGFMGMFGKQENEKVD